MTTVPTQPRPTYRETDNENPIAQGPAFNIARTRFSPVKGARDALRIFFWYARRFRPLGVNLPFFKLNTHG